MRKFLVMVLGLSMLEVVYGMYYTISRPYFGVDLYGAWMVVYLIGAEYTPSLFSFMLGALGDTVGRRVLMAIGGLGVIPLFHIFTLTDWRQVVVSVGLFNLFSWLVFTFAMSSIIEDRARIGSKYSVAGLGMGLGWGIGALIAWPLFNYLGNYLFSTTLSTIYALSSLLVIIGYSGKERENTTPISALKTVFSELHWFAPIILFSSIGLSIASSMTSILLDYKIRELPILNKSFDSRLFYGLFYGTIPVLAGTPARIIAGRLVDNRKEEKLLLTALSSYLVLFLVLPFTPPILYILLWLIPIYPFYDTSIYAILSRNTNKYEATATGFLASINSLAGVLIIILNTIKPLENTIDYLVRISFFLGFSLIFTIYRNLRYRKEHE